jgi:hypothetical protein
MADIREMRVGEKETIGLDFAPDLAANEYFSSANVTCANGLSANGSPTIGGNNNTCIRQTFTVDANTTANYYTVTFTGTTDGGNIKKRVYVIRVVTDTVPSAANATLALVRLDEAKAYLGKVTDEDTAIIEQIIESVGVRFNSYTDRHLVTATYTNEAYDGNGFAVMYLKNYPIVANLAVTENDTALTVGNNNDYLAYNDEGKLVRINNVWYYGPKQVQVTYTAGYNATSGNVTLPTEIRMAALQQVAYEFGRYQRKDLGLDAVTYPDGSVARTQTGLLKEVEQVLDGHRRYSF